MQTRRGGGAGLPAEALGSESPLADWLCTALHRNLRNPLVADRFFVAGQSIRQQEPGLLSTDDQGGCHVCVDRCDCVDRRGMG